MDRVGVAAGAQRIRGLVYYNYTLVTAQVSALRNSEASFSSEVSSSIGGSGTVSATEGPLIEVSLYI